MNAKTALSVGVFALTLLSGIAFGSYAQNPDIQVTTPITIEPLSVEQGELVTIRAEVSNRETVPLDRSFDVAFLVQRNGGPEQELSSETLRCLTFPKTENFARCRVPGLSARGQPNDKLEVRAQLDTAQLEPGQYTIFVVADPEGEIAETKENNNRGEPESVLTVRPQRPNLTILATFTLEPAEPRQGDLLIIAFAIENDRPADVTAPVPLSFLLRKRGEIAFRELRPPAIRCPELPVLNERCTLAEGLRGGERRTIRVDLITSLLDPGDYQLRIIVDPDNEVTTEVDKNDNVLTIDFTLQQPPRNLRLAEGRLTPQSLAKGGLVSALFVIRNESIVPTKDVELALTLTHRETGEQRDVRTLLGFACGPLGSFLAGEDRCRKLTLKAQSALQIVVQFSTEELPLGDYELLITVDPENVIEELDEQDNALKLSFNVVETPEEVVVQTGPELHPLAIRFTPSSPVVQGQAVLITAEIENSGTRDAGAFIVEFALRREDVTEGQSTADFVPFSSQTLSGLRLGRTVGVQAILDTSGLEPGLYAIRVVVRALEDLELDPDNNVLIALLTVRAPPES